MFIHAFFIVMVHILVAIEIGRNPQKYNISIDDYLYMEYL